MLKFATLLLALFIFGVLAHEALSYIFDEQPPASYGQRPELCCGTKVKREWEDNDTWEAVRRRVRIWKEGEE